MREELKNIVQLIGMKDRLMNAALAEVKEARQTTIRDLELRIQQHIISIKSTNSFTWVDILARILEGVLLLTIVFLAGRWSNDPQDNYEPYIVILTVVMPIVEIVRWLYKRSTT